MVCRPYSLSLSNVLTSKVAGVCWHAQRAFEQGDATAGNTVLGDDGMPENGFHPARA